jgi:hypothetical protein
MMLNFCVGAVSNLSELVREIGEISSIDGTYIFRFINENQYAAQIAPYVYEARQDLSEVHSQKWTAIKYLRQIGNTGYTFISDPKLLGTRSDFLRRGKVFPLAEGRISRLCEILQDQEVTFHMMILSQVDFIMSRLDVPLERRVRALLTSRLSWANIAGRILKSAPGCNLIVWDMEKAAPALLDFLNFITPFASEAVHSLLVSTVSSKVPAFTDSISLDLIGELQDVILRLDEKFEEDLERIAQMPNAFVRRF